MQYNGKLYGKIGRKYLDLGKHSDDYDRLAYRERKCESMDEAEKFALVRAIQEIAHSLGMTDENSPREIVERVKLLSENSRAES